MSQPEIDPARVTRLREGNAIWPGLLAFSGVTFLVYLGVEAASGAVAVNGALAAQLAVAAVLAVAGIYLMARARYFYVILTTDAGDVKFSGLSKAEQSALAERYRPK